MSTPYREPRIVFYDLETGGLDPQKHPVIQFAGVAVHVDRWEVMEELELKIRFRESDCDPEALEANSYNRVVWAGEAVNRNAAIRRIGLFFRDHATVPMEKSKKPGEYWWACQTGGHNAARFDDAFLRAMFDSANEFCIASFMVLDTLQLAMWANLQERLRAPDPDAVEEPPNLKLETLCDRMGIPLEAHDALEDVRATAELARRLLRAGEPRK